jgi:hypothetical protein
MRKKFPVSRGGGPSVPQPWTFLTNHTHVLLCVACNPSIRIREIAALVGITERMVQKIVGDLAAADYLSIEKEGRRNSYRLNAHRPLRHPLEAHCQVGQLLDLLQAPRRK